MHLRDILQRSPAGFAGTALQPSRPENSKTLLEWPELAVEGPIIKEDRTGKRFTVVQVPIELLCVDEAVNPRHLQRARLEKMVEAFRGKQTHFRGYSVPIAPPEERRDELAVFDGSHGTASEILAGAQLITCKVYLPNELSSAEAFEWNTDAHNSLRQQEFRSRVLMSRRAKLFKDDFDKFLSDPAKSTFPRSERGSRAFLPAYERPQKLEAIFDYVYSAVLEDEHEAEIEDATTKETRTIRQPASNQSLSVRTNSRSAAVNFLDTIS